MNDSPTIGDQLANDSPKEAANERSYTPCLDEQVNPDDDRKDGNSSDEDRRSTQECASVNAGIEGMETELISEDENENLLVDRERPRANAADKVNSNKRKSSKDDSFKKVSKSTKERHYRDKREAKPADKGKHRRTKSRSKSKKRTSSRSSRSLSRSRSRSRSRSFSRSRSRSRNRSRNLRRNNRFRRRENKRQEIQRYDVRHVIADRPPRVFKDKYGRNTSRTRSPSPPPPRRRRSRSPSRSQSPKYPPRRRSGSRKRSASRRRSISRRRRSPSRNNNQRRRRNSTSRSRRQRSVSHSPLHRSPLPAYFSSSRSNSRDRVINGGPNARTLRSPPHSKSPTPTRQMPNHRYQSDRSRSRSRSQSRSKGRTKKRSNDKKLLKTRVKKKVPTRHGSPFAASPNRNIVRGRRSLSKTWEETNRDVSWNRSPNRAANDDGEPSWTPPIGTRPTENLTVILKNKDSSKRKRDKKKKTEKRRRESSPSTRKEKRKQRAENAPAQPSKEVFASGDNILVSVSFNKDKPQQPAQQTTIVTLPPSKDQILSKKQSEHRDGGAKRSRRGTRDVGGGPRKHKKIDIKPVAIIDLDNSPFKEMTPSPKAVIVLSDSDHEADKLISNNKSQSNYSKTLNATENIDHDHGARESNARVPSQPQSPVTEATSFEISLGPKTPPEPHLIKFSITSNRRQLTNRWKSPMMATAEDDDVGSIGGGGGGDDHPEDGFFEVPPAVTEENSRPEAAGSRPGAEHEPADKQQTSQQKVGPNTPPESGPCSPDAYDPFEPTKSPSQSPNDVIHSTSDEMPPGPTAGEDKTVKSVDLVMALINSKASLDAANSMLSSTLEGEAIEQDSMPVDEANVSPFKDKPICDDGSGATKPSAGIHVFSNIMIAPGKDTANRMPSQSRANATSVTTISASSKTSTPTKQSPMKFGSSLISKLPMPPKLSKATRHNGNDDNADVDSPYSPGSSDYEDLFEPPQISPSPLTGNAKKHGTRTARQPGK